MMALFYIAGFVVIAYCLFIAYISFFVKKEDDYNGTFTNKISIIIPCRNEAENIGHCLASIAKQTLSKGQFEVIIVDDFSEDNTVKIAEQFNDRSDIKILHNTFAGKKNALTLGIANASNEIIITTDADCTMDPDWLKRMLNTYETKKLNMLCGPVNFNDSNSLFEQLQQVESAAVVGISAVMLNKHKPSTCNGANLMFSKTIFDKLGGYKNHSFLATGDDDLLMHEFYKLDPSKVKYCLGKNVMVYTKACTNFNQFLHQRIRWLAKRKHYIYKWNNWLQILVFCQLLAFYYLLFYGIIFGDLLVISILINKYIFDMILGVKLRPIFKFNFFQILLMPFFEFYIFIVLFFSGSNKGQWKGRDL